VNLTLQITGPASSHVRGPSHHTFDEAGGRLGRDPDNDWELAHARVSAYHALISWRNGVFYIEDQSTNGTCLNSPQNRLPRGRPHALSPGDRLFIGPYEIQVSLTDGRAAERRSAGRGSALDTDPFQRISSGDEIASVVSGPAFDSETVDPMVLLGEIPGNSEAKPARTPHAEDLEGASLPEEYYKPPRVTRAPAVSGDAGAIPAGYNPLDSGTHLPVVPPPAKSPVRPVGPEPQSAAAVIPPNYDPLALDDPLAAHDPFAVGDSMPVCSPAGVNRFHHESDTFASEHAVAETPQVPPAMPEPAERPPALQAGVPREEEKDKPSFAVTDLAAILSAAGIDPSVVTPETARDFGEILRVVVSGLMELLRSRQQIKDEFRMRMTQFKPAENNPLKFSANVDDALHNLLVKRNAAYLTPVKAFEESFSDLRAHQLAMLAGIRAAFEAMLADFDPARLQEEFDRRLKMGLVPARLQYWDLYREKVEAIQSDRERASRRLFGEEFARAYEEQFREVKEQERAATTPRRQRRERES
jgi:type VI secretion system FHA domain protein